ncbi:hypothetical protein [Burkholderia multivorans]|uniref:hypothetical protein n=1 Tax=Burkholderia multivorans TaxID=87883 RepID=UPI003F571CA5
MKPSLRTRPVARPRLARIGIVVLGWCLLSLGLDEASSAQQLDFADAVRVHVFADLGKYGLLFPLPCFFNKQVQLTELLLQLSNGRSIHERFLQWRHHFERKCSVELAHSLSLLKISSLTNLWSEQRFAVETESIRLYMWLAKLRWRSGHFF